MLGRLGARRFEAAPKMARASKTPERARRLRRGCEYIEHLRQRRWTACGHDRRDEGADCASSVRGDATRDRSGVPSHVIKEGDEFCWTSTSAARRSDSLKRGCGFISVPAGTIRSCGTTRPITRGELSQRSSEPDGSRASDSMNWSRCSDPGRSPRYYWTRGIPEVKRGVLPMSEEKEEPDDRLSERAKSSDQEPGDVRLRRRPLRSGSSSKFKHYSAPPVRQMVTIPGRDAARRRPLRLRRRGRCLGLAGQPQAALVLGRNTHVAR